MQQHIYASEAGAATPEQQVRAACNAKKIGLYVCREDRFKDRPHIHLMSRGMTLSSHRNFEQALQWLGGTQ